VSNNILRGYAANPSIPWPFRPTAVIAAGDEMTAVDDYTMKLLDEFKGVSVAVSTKNQELRRLRCCRRCC